MKKILFAVAAAAGLGLAAAMAADIPRPPPVVATPVIVVPAQPRLQGWVGIDGGRIWSDPAGLEGSIVNLTGAVNIPLGALNLEIEGRGGWSNSPLATGLTFGMVHAFWRSQNFAVGAFGGLEEYFYPAPTPPGGEWTLGGEAQAYLGRLMLYGQAASYWFTGGGAAYWSARGSATFFITDNVALTGDAKYVYGASLGTNAILQTGVMGEVRFGGPLSAYAALRNFRALGTVSGSITTAVGGVRFHFGNGTLRQQYTTGASMNVIPVL